MLYHIISYYLALSLYKKWSFPLRVSSVTKLQETADLVTFTEEINEKLYTILWYTPGYFGQVINSLGSGDICGAIWGKPYRTVQRPHGIAMNKTPESCQIISTVAFWYSLIYERQSCALQINWLVVIWLAFNVLSEMTRILSGSMMTPVSKELVKLPKTIHSNFLIELKTTWFL